MTTNNELLILRKQLGRAIAQLRADANLSVRELSARCGIHYTSINKLEKGNYNASIDIINTILITLKSQLTMEKRNYTIELEEDKVEYLRNLDSEYLRNCELSGTPIEDWYLGECRFRPFNEVMAERNSKLADELNYIIPSTFDGQTGECDGTSIYINAKNFDIESTKNNCITIYDGDDDYFGSIVFRLEGNTLEMVIFVQSKEYNKIIAIDNPATASEVVNEIDNKLAEVFCI